ncbi:hypothetical protein [Deinococcus maricopensis]|uniref:Zn-finger containing protein n=1 Tax=Deinococcus maricopensis (strain DSM 21211 / LMG 22137 / NRRL B-23946 / LB-34) TaxID=709986 RepID=E8U5Q0_DEIML|nr:hypothetical protein [Deinococcus maricopensis]ADV66389.1 hypothetical protein Deima_0733 [Deinococcus maricopensis DSM 21211]
MNFPFRCPACDAATTVPYADTGMHDVRCASCRARYALYLRQHKFETLFDFGARALLDGYGREATLNFASSLERALEFYLRATTLERAAGTDAPLEDAQAALDATWRTVASQSERQLGAFAFAYLTREGRAPDFLTPGALGTDFRNRVVHRGYIPTRAEVDAYAEKVYAITTRLLRDLGDAVTHAQLEQERAFEAHLLALPDDVQPVFLEHSGILRAARHATHGAPVAAPANDPGAFARVLQERAPLIERLFTKMPKRH